MSVTHLRKWDVTAIEIALDLEIPRSHDRSRGFSSPGPAEPRICLVAALRPHVAAETHRRGGRSSGAGTPARKTTNDSGDGEVGELHRQLPR